MELFNLIAADLKRIKKDKSLITILIINAVALIVITVILMAVGNFAVSALKSGAMEGVEGIEELEKIGIEQLAAMINASMAVASYQLVLSTGIFGLFLTISISIFIGAEFSFNTIRNKIVSGNPRVKIFLSSYVSALIIGLIFYVVDIAVQFIVATMCFGFISTGGVILKAALLSILPYASLIAIACFVSMTTKSRSLGITLNILILVLLPTFLSIFAGLSDFTKSIVSVIPYDILSQLLSYNIESAQVGRLVQVGGINSMLVLKAILSPLCFIAAFLSLGAFLFKRADIK